MYTRFLFLVTIFLGLCHSANTQDIHFTQFQLAPLTLNPALTGAYPGTFRVGGIYRGQWVGQIDGFSQPTLYVDAPIIRGLGKYDWIGVGISLTNLDNAGSINSSIGSTYLSLSYHLALDKKRNSVLSFGLQGGSFSRSVSIDGAIANETILTGSSTNFETALGISQNAMNRDLSGSGFDFNLGVLYKSKLNKKNSLELGLTGAHLLQPNVALKAEGSSQDSLELEANTDIRFTAHGKITSYLNKTMRFEPVLFVQKMGQATEIALQSNFGFLIDPKKGTIVNAGLGYRVGDAVQLLFGIEQGNLQVGASWDFTASSLQNAGGLQNAFELGVGYIFNISKKPNVKPVIFCPRF